MGYQALILFVSALFALQGWGLNVPKAHAATSNLFLSPSSSRFQVDSTFEVSIYLNTQGNSVNTIDLALSYPPDKLQLVSSGTGKSIIGLWTSQPKYNNQTGLLELTGGIPGGIKVERGLITTLTFRAKAVGNAIVKFERTEVLLNDGQGTEVLAQTQNSIYEIVLPPPAGPVVVSDTHPDQTRWYKDRTVNLRWGGEAGSDGFSYIISNNPADIPDDISEGQQNAITYKDVGEGRSYFHIRGLRGGAWGGTTHFALNIDYTPPADFKIEVIPNSRTTRVQPVIQFATTDTLSGADHYELMIVPVSLDADSVSVDGHIFVEAQSPYVPPILDLGRYDVIVRAFDKAGNYREVVERVEIVQAMLRFIGPTGLELRSSLIIPWWILITLMIIIIIALWILGRRMHVWHNYIDRKRNTQSLPETLAVQMEELQKYRAKYGRLTVLTFLMTATIFGSLFGTSQAQAQERSELFNTPIVTTLSKNISNEEIFYIGGRTGKPDSQVVIYIQNEQTAETFSETVEADEDGEWFYRHDDFLQAGRYVLWTQARDGNELSPPSPQVTVEVEETAVQLGATRISYATLYMILFGLTLLVAIGLLIYILYHSTQGRKKHAQMEKEISEAQESLRRGFAVLNRDIQAELELIRRAKLDQSLSQEQIQKEAQLLMDLQQIEQYLSKEIWDIEHVEQGVK